MASLILRVIYKDRVIEVGVDNIEQDIAEGGDVVEVIEAKAPYNKDKTLILELPDFRNFDNMA
jgi:hypothetical protein